MAQERCDNCKYIWTTPAGATVCRFYPQVLIGFIVKGSPAVTTVSENELNIQSFFNHSMTMKDGWCGQWKSAKKK